MVKPERAVELALKGITGIWVPTERWWRVGAKRADGWTLVGKGPDHCGYFFVKDGQVWMVRRNRTVMDCKYLKKIAALHKDVQNGYLRRIY